jgi:rhamnogalacturonan hydrolase
MQFSSLIVAAVALLPTAVLGQLSGKVGPLTTHAAKSKVKTCSVLDYGGKADKSTDIGPALLKAFAACKTGGTVVVPAGDYAMQTWATFEGGKAWALQLDGVIYRTGTDGGNMLFIRNANDFEMFSSTGKGAVQGEYTNHGLQARCPNALVQVSDTRTTRTASATAPASCVSRRQTTSPSTTSSLSTRPCSTLS